MQQRSRRRTSSPYEKGAGRPFRRFEDASNRTIRRFLFRHARTENTGHRDPRRKKRSEIQVRAGMPITTQQRLPVGTHRRFPIFETCRPAPLFLFSLFSFSLFSIPYVFSLPVKLLSVPTCHIRRIFCCFLPDARHLFCSTAVAKRRAISRVSQQPSLSLFIRSKPRYMHCTHLSVP